jgi:hypothetical protein
MSKNKNEVAKVKENKTNLMFSVDESAMDKMNEDAKGYVDNTSPDDIAMPRIKILQSASDEVKKSSPEFIQGAEEGDLLNTLSKTVFKAEDGLLFIPAFKRIVYLEWKDRAAGGGLVANYGEDPTAFLEANVQDNGKRISKAGNEIVKTYDFFGYILDVAGNKVSEVVLSMSKTQAKKAKNWNTVMRQLTSKEGNQLPIYAGVYKLTTIAESNDKGSWFNYNVEFVGYTLGVKGIGTQIYDKAESFAKLISENSVKVGYENEASDSSSEDRV